MILAAVVFVALLVSGILTGQLFIKMLPCFISLAVLFFSANANRFAYLLGGINSLIYCIGYYLEGLYGSVLQSVIAGFLFQILIFFRWKKHAVEKSTKLREFSWPVRIVTVAATLLASWGFSLLLNLVNGNNTVLDSMVFIVGLVGTALIYFGYVDQWIFTAICGVVSLAIWCVRISDDIAAITYLIYSVYNLIKIAEGAYKWHRICKIQRLQVEQPAGTPPDAEELPPQKGQ